MGQGDCVAVMLRNDIAYLELMLALDALGAHLVGLNWHFRGEEAGYVIRDSGARAVVVHADLLPHLQGSVPNGATLLAVRTPEDVLQPYGLPGKLGATPEGVTDYQAWRDSHEPLAGAAPASPGAMLYTSGTTGRPKGVRRLPPTAAQAAAGRRLRTLVSGLRPGLRTCLVGPLYHANPAAAARQALEYGSLVVVAPRFEAEQLLRDIERHRLTHLALVPIMLIRLLRLPAAIRARYDVSSLERCTFGGSPCPADVKAGMIAWWGPVLAEVYGSTELGIVTCTSSQDILERPTSVGRALPGVKIRVLDDAGRPLPAGQVGEIAVDPGENVPPFTYHNAEDERRAVDRDGYVTNGDCGYLDEDGYLHVTDRKRDMVISGGVNIYPSEIEEALRGLPGVSDCAVFGAPDPEFGESLVAAVQADPACIGEAAVKDHLRRALAAYKVPRRVEFHDNLPRDDMGKVQKRILRERYWSGSGRSI